MLGCNGLYWTVSVLFYDLSSLRNDQRASLCFLSHSFEFVDLGTPPTARLSCNTALSTTCNRMQPDPSWPIFPEPGLPFLLDQTSSLYSIFDPNEQGSADLEESGLDISVEFGKPPQ